VGSNHPEAATLAGRAGDQDPSSTASPNCRMLRGWNAAGCQMSGMSGMSGKYYGIRLLYAAGCQMSGLSGMSNANADLKGSTAASGCSTQPGVRGAALLRRLLLLRILRHRSTSTTASSAATTTAYSSAAAPRRVNATRPPRPSFCFAGWVIAVRSFMRGGDLRRKTGRAREIDRSMAAGQCPAGVVRLALVCGPTPVEACYLAPVSAGRGTGLVALPCALRAPLLRTLSHGRFLVFLRLAGFLFFRPAMARARISRMGVGVLQKCLFEVVHTLIDDECTWGREC